MISKWLWTLRSVLRELWVRVAAFALLAILTAAMAPLLAPLIPQGWAEAFGGGAVSAVLQILASSMLAVTTFSLSIAANAFTAAENSATPRSTALLQKDTTTQTTLATFLGAFVYSVVGIVGLNAGYYSAGARVVLFGATVLVLMIVVVALLRWMGYLPDFGRMDNTLDRVEEAAHDALATRLDKPWMGGHPYKGDVPAGAVPVRATETGYVQHVDMGALNEAATERGCQIYLSLLPGDFVYNGAPMLYCLGEIGEADVLRGAITIRRTRTFDQDPRYGMIVMAEIGSRALSPGVNDPGTAIAVINRELAVLARWRSREGPDVHFDAVHVPSSEPRDLVESAFRPIIRDGASNAEVQLHVMDALDALNKIAPDVFGEVAKDLLNEIMERTSEGVGLSTRDRDDLAKRRAATGI
ncbi:DUF2254 domain-containing protein [Gymnodinialimonas ceratoperidinii]|uniref:DUF2254 domain-containing protein n=1 Tax=Gymnodinialimonas ceratoperidinii TaxID=2856823 RepID=A0A8F6YBP5_9RHOB|nr:DUF2254 domain-containing protein [Gymnodinialimonas ceratoperidinii]QXT38392.1 DUF2254 domain-containing protein [Gymnodinialimonas ceratoperidinii]